MKYFLFLDETGDHGLGYIDKNFPLFLLCGLIISEDSLRSINLSVNEFKKKYFETKEVVLHSRDIRKCEGAFQILFDLKIKEKFYKDLNEILGKSDYALIGSGVQKELYVKRYGKGAKDPYSISLTFIIERLIFYLDNQKADDTVEIVAEERGKKEDRQLLSHFNSIMDLGTYYIDKVRLKKRIRNFSFCTKRKNIIGLQLADLCAYPLARHILNPEEPYIPFNIIKDKMYSNDKGKYWGWGLKLFP